MKKLLSLVLALALVLGMTAAAGAETVTELPRNETLYHGGWQYGAIAAWNPLHTNSNNSMAISANPRGSRTLVWETLYMYNALDGKLYPLLADWGGAGATVPLTGFGHALAQGVRDAVREQGLIGALTGGLTACAGGVSAAVFFALLAALIFPRKDK